MATGYSVSATNLFTASVSGSTGTFGSLTVGGVAVTGGGGQGERISTSNVASGATLGMVVADKGTISFTLAGSAGAAYIHPTLGFVWPGVSTSGGISGTGFYTAGAALVTQVSTTNISMTVSQCSPIAVASIAGGGGNYIASQSTSVSVSNVVAQGSPIRFATAGTLAMIISGSNVGIGTAAPNAKLTIGSANLATNSWNTVNIGSSSSDSGVMIGQESTHCE